MAGPRSARKSAGDKLEKAAKSLLDAHSDDETGTEQLDAQMAADFAALDALAAGHAAMPSVANILQADVEKAPTQEMEPAFAGGTASLEVEPSPGQTLPLAGSASRDIQAEQAALGKAERRKQAADRRKQAAADKAEVKRVLTAQAAADAVQAKELAAAAALAAATAPVAPAEVAASGGGGVDLAALPPHAFAAQLEQNLVGACVAAIRRALPDPKQLDTGALVGALISGLQSGSTFTAFEEATDDIIADLQRLTEAAENDGEQLKELGEYIAKNLSDAPAKFARMDVLLTDVRARQRDIITGQREIVEGQRTMLQSILEAIASINEGSKSRRPESEPARARSPSEKGARARLTSYGLGEGLPAVKRSNDTGLASAWNRPHKQARPTLAEGAIPSDPAKLGKHQVVDTDRLICMAANHRDLFFPHQSDLLDALAEAGVEDKMTTVGGAFLKECIPINGAGPRCRTWRLVATDPDAKVTMMRRFQQLTVALNEVGLEASHWIWGRPNGP